MVFIYHKPFYDGDYESRNCGICEALGVIKVGKFNQPVDGCYSPTRVKEAISDAG